MPLVLPFFYSSVVISVIDQFLNCIVVEFTKNFTKSTIELQFQALSQANCVDMSHHWNTPLYEHKPFHTNFQSKSKYTQKHLHSHCDRMHDLQCIQYAFPQVVSLPLRIFLHHSYSKPTTIESNEN